MTVKPTGTPGSTPVTQPAATSQPVSIPTAGASDPGISASMTSLVNAAARQTPVAACTSSSVGFQARGALNALNTRLSPITHFPDLAKSLRGQRIVPIAINEHDQAIARASANALDAEGRQIPAIIFLKRDPDRQGFSGTASLDSDIYDVLDVETFDSGRELRTIIVVDNGNPYATARRIQLALANYLQDADNVVAVETSDQTSANVAATNPTRSLTEQSLVLFQEIARQGQPVQVIHAVPLVNIPMSVQTLQTMRSFFSDEQANPMHRLGYDSLMVQEVPGPLFTTTMAINLDRAMNLFYTGISFPPDPARLLFYWQDIYSHYPLTLGEVRGTSFNEIQREIGRTQSTARLLRTLDKLLATRDFAAKFHDPVAAQLAVYFLIQRIAQLNAANPNLSVIQQAALQEIAHLPPRKLSGALFVQLDPDCFAEEHGHSRATKVFRAFLEINKSLQPYASAVHVDDDSVIRFANRLHAIAHPQSELADAEPTIVDETPISLGEKGQTSRSREEIGREIANTTSTAKLLATIHRILGTEDFEASFQDPETARIALYPLTRKIAELNQTLSIQTLNIDDRSRTSFQGFATMLPDSLVERLFVAPTEKTRNGVAQTYWDFASWVPGQDPEHVFRALIQLADVNEAGYEEVLALGRKLFEITHPNKAAVDVAKVKEFFPT